jgi:hypothetical protein
MTNASFKTVAIGVCLLLTSCQPDAEVATAASDVVVPLDIGRSVIDAAPAADDDAVVDSADILVLEDSSSLDDSADTQPSLSDISRVDDVEPTSTPPDTVSSADVGTKKDAASTSPPWRSALYPKTWTPAHQDAAGRFLHDFSWAGYHNGGVKLGLSVKAKTIDVVKDHGADPTGNKDATGALNEAIAAAVKAGGGVVYLPKGTYRCDGQVMINTSGIVLRGDGPTQTRVYFTKHLPRQARPWRPSAARQERRQPRQ